MATDERTNNDFGNFPKHITDKQMAVCQQYRYFDGIVVRLPELDDVSLQDKMNASAWLLQLDVGLMPDDLRNVIREAYGPGVLDLMDQCVSERTINLKGEMVSGPLLKAVVIDVPRGVMPDHT